jgi:gentisate 1,2-dioxygenase
MINITSYDTPIVYQTGTGNLPSFSGAVQWNGNSKKFQVSTGYGWQDIDNNVNLSASQDMVKIINWAQEKMREEEEIKKLAQTNPSVASIIGEIEESKKKLKVLTTLIK